jgi:hypothetical protein
MFSGEQKSIQYWIGITLIYDMEQVLYKSESKNLLSPLSNVNFFE